MNELKNLKHYYTIHASAEDVFNALVNPFTIELWSDAPAVMDDQPGTEFSLWDGDISGENLEVIPNKKIVQKWFFGDQEEDSIVTILLHPAKNACKVELTHTNIPAEDFENIEEGWREYYLGAIKRFLEI